MEGAKCRCKWSVRPTPKLPCFLLNAIFDLCNIPRLRKLLEFPTSSETHSWLYWWCSQAIWLGAIKFPWKSFPLLWTCEHCSSFSLSSLLILPSICTLHLSSYLHMFRPAVRLLPLLHRISSYKNIYQREYARHLNSHTKICTNLTSFHPFVLLSFQKFHQVHQQSITTSPSRDFFQHSNVLQDRRHHTSICRAGWRLHGEDIRSNHSSAHVIKTQWTNSYPHHGPPPQSNHPLQTSLFVFI